MTKQHFIHTWIGTIAALITTFGWLTGIHSISIPKATGVVNFTFSGNTFGVVIFVISHIMVWGSVFFLTLSIGKAVYRSRFLVVPILVILGVVGYCIELCLFDAFYDASQTIVMSLLTDNMSQSGGFPLGDLLTIGLPIATMVSVYGLLYEQCCGTCGRLTLQHVSTRELEPYDRTEYITKDDGNRIRRIKHYQRYEVKKQCQSCGTVWTFKKSRELGHHDFKE